MAVWLVAANLSQVWNRIGVSIILHIQVNFGNKTEKWYFGNAGPTTNNAALQNNKVCFLPSKDIMKTKLLNSTKPINTDKLINFPLETIFLIFLHPWLYKLKLVNCFLAKN